MCQEIVVMNKEHSRVVIGLDLHIRNTQVKLGREGEEVAGLRRSEKWN